MLDNLKRLAGYTIDRQPKSCSSPACRSERGKAAACKPAPGSECGSEISSQARPDRTSDQALRFEFRRTFIIKIWRL
jgi:hypothetical protein